MHLVVTGKERFCFRCRMSGGHHRPRRPFRRRCRSKEWSSVRTRSYARNRLPTSHKISRNFSVLPPLIFEENGIIKTLKVSIANVKAAVNPTVDPYGTFDVFVRDAKDTDNSLSLLESFTGLNLNPASPNYIARRIGDRYLSWNTTEKYYEEYGTYTNVSKYIRMEMNDEVDNASANPAVLPFGYFGPIRTATQTDH